MTEKIIVLELHSLAEVCALAEAIEKRMSVLANGYTREEVLKFLSLQQIAVRMPQVTAQEKREEANHG